MAHLTREQKFNLGRLKTPDKKELQELRQSTLFQKLRLLTLKKKTAIKALKQEVDASLPLGSS